ncbi:hypothetical protein PRIPAC_93419 [Pristionchus pacificus]|uniref:Uncharacterized protein n=1 Tax=Pristionchus pacificus TaxID=54126 RepID=A0A2A6CIA3_PRIPA|nr:hypothetical protein PRIPAC_93419 [Pristionchus pacificus]|eukprot:PDM77932.1 hypothetical protein PRIPAC_34799 [Pristionchus pacificus]
MDDPYGRFVAYKKDDPGSWDEEDFDRPWNKDSIDKFVRGHWQQYKRHEHASYLKDDGKEGFVNPEEFPARIEKLHKDVRDLIKRRAFNSESQSELQRGFWNAYEREYQSRLKGKKEETKINLVATSLFNCCLDEERRKKKGFIDDPAFLLWLFERNLVSRRGIATKFLDLIEWKTRGTWDYGEDETRRLEKTGEKLCSWNVLLSRRAATTLATLKKHRPDDNQEEAKMKASELWTCIQREDTDEEKEKEEEGEETASLLSSVSRDFALIRLLDNEQFDRDHDLGEMIERMAEIDWPENQLPLLLEWALRHRSAMGCTLAARIIARWSLPSTRSDLLLFIINARPPPNESEGRRRRGVGKGGGMMEGGKGEGKERFVRSLTRLFVALSYEELLTYQDLHEVYTSNKEDFDGRASQGYSLPDLLASLPLIGEAEKDGDRTRKKEYWKRIVALLNGMFCHSAHSWHDPMSAEQEAAARVIVEKVRSLSHREAHELATRAGNAILAEWHEAKGEDFRIFLPSRSALLLVCQLMDATVDSSLLPRFLLQCLPYLLGVSRLTPQLAVYASTAALFLTARCFQSHLTLHAMGAWRILRRRTAALVHTLCPAHWQTRRLVELFELELPQGCCPMQHACDVSDARDPVAVEKEATAMLQTQLEKKEKWDERRLTTVADLAGDVGAQVDTQTLRDWWRVRLVDEITSGPKKTRKSMLRLLSLSAYRGVIAVEEEVERAREGLRKDDPSIVSASLAILDTLLVGTSNRREEELLVERMIGGEAVAAVIDDIVRMMGQPCSPRVSFECTSMQSRLMKRQFGKRAMREEMEEIAMREDSADKAELYRQIARKCSANGWSGLEVEEGGRGLAAVTLFEADAARREMRWILVKEQNEKTSPTRVRLAESIWEGLRGEPSSSCLQYVLLHELRAEMIEEEEAPSHCAPAYRAFAASMISAFIGLMKEPKRLASSSSLLLPIVLFVWRDADDESRGRLRTEIRGFLRGSRGGETTHLLLIARLAVSLSEGLRGKEGREWIGPFYELIRQGVIGPERNGELFEQVLEMMERIESEDEMEDKGRKEEEEERLNFVGWSTEEILRFLKPVQEFVKVQWYEMVKPRDGKRGGLRISACRKFASDEWLDAHSLSPRGRWFCMAGKRRKLMEDMRAIQYGMEYGMDGTADNPIEI